MKSLQMAVYREGKGGYNCKLEMAPRKRVLVIGAGPSGLSTMIYFNRQKAQGKEIPEIVCYEKQSDWGGLWNYSWETGVDKYGEPVHASMYRGLFSNVAKECCEFPDYTYLEHFGKPIPSYPPREVLFDYLKGRWEKSGVRDWIRFNHCVRQVTYNDATDDFTVVVKNLPEDKDLPAETFDYVVVAVGHFSVPYVPQYPGIEQFTGRVIHSHELRNSCQFKGKKVLLIGAGYSSEDIALQCAKYDAESVIITWRTKPMGFNWPPQITEKPLLTKIEGNTVHFKDGTTAEVDDIILCTGYLLHFPFMEERLRLKSGNCFYLLGTYKGIVWMNGGNCKVMYIGMENQCYSYTLFDAQAHWLVKYVLGDITLPGQEEMESDSKKWLERSSKLEDIGDIIDYQTEYILDLTKESNYGYDLNCADILHTWSNNKRKNIVTYREHSHTSKFTGVKSPVHRDPFMKAYDDSLEYYVNQK